MKTGCVDSQGRMICVGDYVRMRCVEQAEAHGEWAYLEVVQRGMVLLLSYCRSAKGQVLPRGHVVLALADLYDRKELLHAEDISTVRPIEHVVSLAVF